MQPSSRPFMASFWFTFQLLCIVCCIIAVTSYKIDYRPTIDERNDRAVTEWRFRRNYFVNHPHFFRSQVKNNRGINNDENNLYNQPDEIKEYEKKFIIPQLMVPQ